MLSRRKSQLSQKTTVNKHSIVDSFIIIAI